MNESPSTRQSLLLRIRDVGDHEAWSQFVEIYATLLYDFTRRRGLQDADAADLTQEVLQRVARAGRDYDPARGPFRRWLFTVTMNELRRFWSSQNRRFCGTGDATTQALFEDQPSREEEQADLWDKDFEQRRFAWAAEQVRRSVQETTWNAFWQTAIEGKSGKESAVSLGMTVASVYLAKSRVIARLREQLQQLQDD